jgi:hypothetical protein
MLTEYQTGNDLIAEARAAFDRGGMDALDAIEQSTFDCWATPAQLARAGIAAPKAEQQSAKSYADDSWNLALARTQARRQLLNSIAKKFGTDFAVSFANEPLEELTKALSRKSRAESSASWDRAFARNGTPVHVEPTDSWSKAFQRAGIPTK